MAYHDALHLDPCCLQSLGVFTEKSYSKSLEHNVIHIPVTVSSHAMPK